MAAIDRGTQTKREIARLFGVHESFLYKLVRQRREQGHIAALPHGGGAVTPLADTRLAQLEAWLTATPDATLDDLQARLARVGVEVSVTSVWRAVHKLGWTRKKDAPGV